LALSQPAALLPAADLQLLVLSTAPGPVALLAQVP
jgi:hypothetical protein